MSEVRQEYLERIESGEISYYSSAVMINMLNDISRAEEKVGKTLEEGLTREDYVDILNHIGLTCYHSFANAKVITKSYLDYLAERGVIGKDAVDAFSAVSYSEITIKGDKIIYFKNIAMLEEAMAETVSISDCYDPDVFDTPICVAYLTWMGLTEDEIIDVKKSDVLPDGIMLHGELLKYPSEKCKMHIERYRDAYSYFQQARGVIERLYVSTDYLVRSWKFGHLTTDLICATMSRFKTASDKRYPLTCKPIRKSGIFFRAFMKECTDPNFDLKNHDYACRVFDIRDPGINSVYGVVNDYKKYRSLFA